MAQDLVIFPSELSKVVSKTFIKDFIDQSAGHSLNPYEFLVLVVSFRTGSGKYKNLEDSIFVASETVRSLDDKHFEAGFKISKVYSTKTDVTLQ